MNTYSIVEAAHCKWYNKRKTICNMLKSFNEQIKCYSVHVINLSHGTVQLQL